jgi:hypothetical protein
MWTKPQRKKIEYYSILEYDVVYFECEEKKIMLKTAAFYARSPKLRIATISFIISVFPFVRQSVRIQHLGSYWTDFPEESPRLGCVFVCDLET